MQPPFVHGFLTEWGFLSLSSNCTGVMTGWSDAGDDRHHVSMSVMALFCQETLLPTSPPQASALHLVCPVLCGVPRPLGKGGVWAILTHGREHWKFEVAKRVQSECKSKDSKEDLISKSSSFLPPLAPLGKVQGVSAYSVTYSSSLCFRSLDKQTQRCYGMLRFWIKESTGLLWAKPH